MARNQSFAMTKDQYRNQTKTVTRRLGWRFAQVGDMTNGCEKCQGLVRGEKIVVMGQHRFTNLRWERLDRMIDEPEYGQAECIKEGFPEMTPGEFVDMFCKANKCKSDIEVHRMEFEYLIMKTVIKNLDTDEYFAGSHKKIIFWSKWPRKNKFLAPWVYSRKVRPDNDLADLKARGFNVLVALAPDGEM